MRALIPAFLGFFLSPGLPAQINLPGLIQQGQKAIQQHAPSRPANTPRGATTMPATASPAQCQALVQWTAILPREVPNVDFYHTALGPNIYNKMLNLYRDEYFQPLLGKPFAQTTSEERLAYHRAAFRTCATQGQVSPADRKTFQELGDTLGRPFILQHGDFSAETVLTGLPQLQAQLAWSQQVTQALDKMPASPQGFQELDADLKRGQTELEKLWPREKQAFLDAVLKRQSVLARGILENVSLTASKEAVNGFQGAKAITELYRGQDRYLPFLDPESKAQVQKQKDQALAAAIDSAIPAEKQKLAAIPSGFDGAIALVAWENTFAFETRGLPQSPAAQSLVADAEQKRKKLLTTGLPEFKTLVAQHPKPGRIGMDAEALMSKLFPGPADTALPEYQQYKSLLSARLEAVAKEAAAQEAAAAKKAADEEAKAVARQSAGTGTGLKTSCDTYAAHPVDKGRPVGVLGVADDKIVSAPAIAACEQAVKTAPKTARFQFQLGRAYWAAERYDEALDAFLKAEQLDYAPAYFYLGMAYEDGLVAEGGEPDLETARDMYMLAASEGFPPAIAAYQDFEEEEVSDIDYSEMKKPDMMKALYEGNFGPLSQNASDALHYIIGMQSLLNDNDNMLGDLSAKCQSLADTQVATDLQEFLTREGQTRLDSLKGTGGNVLTAFISGMGQVGAHREVEDEGQDDMFFVVGLAPGGCQSPAVQKLYKNLKAFVPEALKTIPGKRTLPAR
jgi:TPR repeat protein